jgi:hypothetical protein
MPNGWRGTISTFALNFIVNLGCLRSVKIFTLKFKLSKICHFLKKNSLEGTNFFFIHPLGSRKIYQKEKKKLGIVL